MRVRLFVDNVGSAKIHARVLFSTVCFCEMRRPVPIAEYLSFRNVTWGTGAVFTLVHDVAAIRISGHEKIVGDEKWNRQYNPCGCNEARTSPISANLLFLA